MQSSCVMTGGKTEENSNTHTHTHFSVGRWNVQQKITGCQVVFTVFSLPGGLSSLSPPSLSSSLFHKYITFMFFPSRTRKLELVLTGWWCHKKRYVCTQEYKLWINVNQRTIYKNEDLFIYIVRVQVYLTPSWTVNRVMEVTQEAHTGAYNTTDRHIFKPLKLSPKTCVDVWEAERKRERGRECFLVCVHRDYDVLTLNCEDSAGLLTPEMWYLLSAEMMGW